MPINLADPDFEPTDEQLVELARRAFADLPAKYQAIEDKLGEEMRRARELARQK